MPCWVVNDDESSDSSIIEGGETIAGKFVVLILL